MSASGRHPAEPFLDEVTDANGLHCHECRHCLSVWSHKRAEGDSKERFAELHKCPECGKVQEWKKDLKWVSWIDYPWEQSALRATEEQEK